VVPTLAGEPFMEKPPLFFITAAFFAQVASPWLPLHDGARLATGFYMGLALVFLGLASRALNGRNHGWLAVLILLGSVGLYFRAHSLITDTALFCGISMALYGLAIGPERAWIGGFFAGTGAGIAFMSKGLLGPGLIGLTALLLPMFAHWRQRRYFGSWSVALLAALPWVLAWPLALHTRSPDLFDEWLWTNNFGRFLGFVHLGPQSEPFYYFSTLPWYAWPALPLSLWTLWAAWRGYGGGLARPGVQMPLTAFLVMLAVLSVAADARELYAMPMLLPLSLLAAGGVDSLQRGASGFLDWFGMLTFGLLALGEWGIWLALLTDFPQPLANWLSNYQPGFIARVAWLPFTLSLFFTLLWFAMVRPARRSSRRAVLNWATGITLFWGLAYTILLPYIDYGKTYRGMIADLATHLPEDGSCVTSRNLGEPQRALLVYFANTITVREEKKPVNDCRMLLVQSSTHDEDGNNRPTSGWSLVWEGHRPGDRNERFRLYERESKGKAGKA
jgi:4-amino-4-deoxy-L-arabinose transferase-like glycosyltransferase